MTRLGDPPAPAAVLEQLKRALSALPPRLRKAAQYLLDHPNEVGISSMRQLAANAGVTPNVLVRLAQTSGFAGYDALREPFRDAVRHGGRTHPDRARWLQDVARQGRHGPLLRQIAATALGNLERLYADTSAETLRTAARLIVKARTAYILGVGSLHPFAHMFAYLARMAFDSVVATPRDGSLPMDDIARAGPQDVLVAMTLHPYRREVADAVRCAHQQGLPVIAITDSWRSPIAPRARHTFIVAADMPQFFASTVPLCALLEALMAFIIAEAKPRAIARIEAFHARRFALGVYWPDGDGPRQERGRVAPASRPQEEGED
jgi:DNA-binding MurR/RpiR family transcriptional regulator